MRFIGAIKSQPELSDVIWFRLADLTKHLLLSGVLADKLREKFV